MSRLLIGLIRLYQRFLSPWLGQNCRFYPTCSHYAIEAIEKHGVLKGVGLAAWRILRCQPFCKGGVDPVPPPRRTSRMGV
ncbi:MAG: membrane protein insertion efficiency factor YidD [Candidatus Hydrogenedentes bacterium]|nr:membrane protein insertion efficiency factor YidD [Candidatus Hydrogenedentota bacterium]